MAHGQQLLDLRLGSTRRRCTSATRSSPRAPPLRCSTVDEPQRPRRVRATTAHLLTPAGEETRISCVITCGTSTFLLGPSVTCDVVARMRRSVRFLQCGRGAAACGPVLPGRRLPAVPCLPSLARRPPRRDAHLKLAVARGAYLPQWKGRRYAFLERCQGR